MRRIVLGMALFLGGCVTHTFAPGPGMSAMNLESEQAQCRLIARGLKAGFEFGASGSPRFVAASTGGAALAYGISSTIEQNTNFNDCMEARGWRVVDGQEPVGTGVSANTVVAAQLPTGMALVGENQRRQFLVRAIDVNFVTGDLRPPHGVMILQVGTGGAAASAGLLERDVVLDFNGSPIVHVGDLQQQLALIGPDSAVTAHIQRDGRVTPISIHF